MDHIFSFIPKSCGQKIQFFAKFLYNSASAAKVSRLVNSSDSLNIHSILISFTIFMLRWLSDCWMKTRHQSILKLWLLCLNNALFFESTSKGKFGWKIKRQIISYDHTLRFKELNYCLNTIKLYKYHIWFQLYDKVIHISNLIPALWQIYTISEIILSLLQSYTNEDIIPAYDKVIQIWDLIAALQHSYTNLRSDCSFTTKLYKSKIWFQLYDTTI